jgi:4-amino-4-deoxy-L-arabinose transferase-like glycosyltransferase
MTAPASPNLSLRERLGALLLLALVFVAGVFDHSLWSNDAREGAMIAEMVRDGRWVTPTFNGAAYLEKPPLMHWTAVVFCRLAGGASEGLVRLPAALYGLGAMLLAVLWARDLGRERAGWAGAFMGATSALYFEYSRVVLTDTTLAFMVTLSLYLFWRAWRTPGPAGSRHAAFLVVSALSFYAKGLLGPGLIWVSVCAFLALQRRWKRLVLLPLLFLPVFLLALLPWVLALARAGGRSYLVDVFWANQFGRFLTLNSPDLPVDPYFVHKEPIWFYLTHLPARLLPWTLFVIPAVAHWFRPRSPLRGELPVFLRTALCAMLLVLHASSAKAAAYAMPLYPVLFLMTGLWLDDALREWSSRTERGIILAVLSLLGLAAILAPLALLAGVAAGFRGWRLFWMCGPFTAAATTLLALLVGGFTIFMFLRTWRGFRSGVAPLFLLDAPMALAVVMALLMTAATPAYDFQRTYKPAVEMVRAEREAGRRLALVSNLERDHGQFLFYLDQPVERLSPSDDLRAFLAADPGTRGLIVPEDYQPEVRAALAGLPLRIRACTHPGYKSAEFILVSLDATPRPTPP